MAGKPDGTIKTGRVGCPKSLRERFPSRTVIAPHSQPETGQPCGVIDSLPFDRYGSVMEDVNGTVAVLTGGGSGIGRATAHALARRGSKVIVSDIDIERAKVVAGEIEAGGGRAKGVRCDVSLLEDVAALTDAALREYGRVDIVMSNVGVIAKGTPLDVPFEAWESIVDINLLGTVRVLQSFLPILIEQGSGHVVTTGSTASLFPYAYDRLPYVATKAAVLALTESLALYARPRGIGVTCFCPAGVMTNIVEQIRQYGPPTPVQSPPLAVISAEDAAELLVQGILGNKLMVLTDPLAESMIQRHAADRDIFLTSQIQYLDERLS
jgi:NAD(P)-dependent dehydrogenase (short-subunit alcohol dehydrogenase family)